MRQRLRDVFGEPVVFYPVLFAAFPILFLYAYNISQTSASQIWLPLGISVGAALAMWAVLTPVLRSRAKAGLATAIFLALFFSYGRLYDGLNYLGVAAPEHAHLLPSMLFAWGYSVYFIGRAGRDFRLTTRLLNVVAVAVIAINLFNIVSYEIGLRGVEAEALPESTQQPVAGEAAPETLPDIYFIILDEYAHPDTMLEYYDYDNSEFIQGLEERGFFVARKSETPAPSTGRALAGVLNMRYTGDHDSPEELHHMIAYNDVTSFLRMHGYEFIYFGNCHDITRWQTFLKETADRYFNYFEESATPWVSEFQEILWSTTMLRPFYYHVVRGQYGTAFRRQTVYALEHLKTLPEEGGRRFMFAHIIPPHEPFVFGAKGEYIAPANWSNYRDKQFYLGQYQYISSEIEGVVDALLEKSEVPPIIILQSDHGLRPGHQGVKVGPDEWRKILNAMYLPGMDYSEIPESISPVNTFRLIFNHYFGAEYEILPDD